jgi:hypothetical protein
VRRWIGARREAASVAAVSVSVSIALALLFSLVITREARAGDCRDDALVRELEESGDAFRAVTVLRARELERRGTPEGLECARMILGEYLRHDEHDLVDDWVTRLGAHYAPLLGADQPLRLKVEAAYLVGHSAEVARRAAESRLPGLAGLVALSAAADQPFSFEPARASAAACPDRGCAELRALLAERSGLPRKSLALALGLGIVPGLGQAYAGRALSGLGSFLLNAFFAGVTAYGIHRHEYALATFSGAVGIALYGGGIYAGYEAAARFNERQAERLRDRIRAIPVDLALTKLAL